MKINNGNYVNKQTNINSFLIKEKGRRDLYTHLYISV